MFSYVSLFENLVYFSVIDHCQPSQCVHGICVNYLATFTCDCAIGYYGTICNIGKLFSQSSFLIIFLAF